MFGLLVFGRRAALLFIFGLTVIWYFKHFTASANDWTKDICVEFGQGIEVNDAADHFFADLDFFGVLAPPFFLGVVKSLSQTSHTQRPEETDRIH